MQSNLLHKLLIYLFTGVEGVLSGACEVMNPDDFQLLVIPFTQTPPIDGRPPLLPPGLPHEFAKVCNYLAAT